MKIEFDPTILSPGDSLSTTDCEQILGIKQDDYKRFRFGLVRLAEYIERGLKKKYTITTKDEGVQVLTHPEALDYNVGRFDVGRGLMRRANRRLQRVSAMSLSAVERTRLAEELAKQGRMILATTGRGCVEPKAAKPAEGIARRAAV